MESIRTANALKKSSPPWNSFLFFSILTRLIRESPGQLKEYCMNVWGKMKKVTLGGMFVGTAMLVGSLTLTGCLTDDKEEDPPKSNAKALTTEKKDTVWNVQGPNKGAYDLVTGAAVSASTANTTKDIVDLAVVAGGAVTWPKTLGSLNGTMFVAAPSTFVYDSATDSTLIKAYAAGGTPTGTTSVLATGTVILAKLRAGGTYAAIKVIKVEETAADNKDYIYFGYKLTP
jgi:hypothetical protein